MGNAEASVVRNVDKRTSRREHRIIFGSCAERFRADPFPAPAQATATGAVGRSLRVCIRKRPLFSHEREQGEFDVITCLPRRVVVHDARMHPDMVRLFMNHHDFVFDEAFGETADNDMVYMGTSRELVLEACQGSQGTVMMYGQTGSGKTYTMSAIYQRAANDLFAHADGKLVTVCFVELLGDNCFDMFNQGASCTLNTAADGSVHPYPSVEVTVQSASELLALIELATKLRATAATGVHDQSSRSHAVCRIFVDCSENGIDAEGCLTLVDLAGSEHRIDNAEHNAERRKEGAKINASLASLKECIRASAAGAKFIAFRQNRLTQLLRGCFVGTGHRTVVIACTSPSSKDTEHSVNTIRHACIMDGQGETKSGQSSHMAGGTVTKELLGEINVTQIARDKRAQRKSEGGGGPIKDEWVKPQPAHQAKQSSLVARASLDARCVRALPSQLSQALLEARQAWGTIRQRARLTRVIPVDDPDPEPEVHKESHSRQHRKITEGDTSRQPGPPSRRASSPGRGYTSEEESALNEGQHMCGGNATEVEQPSCQDDAEEIMISEMSSEHEKALALFRIFCTRGRDAHAWRKNDLRIINSCVVPVLYGEDVHLDWTHPNLALDELERLVGDMPPPAHLLKGPGGQSHAPAAKKPAPSAKAPPRPPVIPGSGSAPSTAGKRPPLSCKTSESPRVRSASATRPTVEKTDESSNRRPHQNARMRSASPASRCSSPGAAPVTHQDAIRARREALEKVRQQSLQKALSKGSKSTMSQDDEIAHLQQQLAENGCSAAAAVGLKKRIAALKAVAIRDERKRKSVQNATVQQRTPEGADRSNADSQTALRPCDEIQVAATAQRTVEEEMLTVGGSAPQYSVSPPRRAPAPFAPEPENETRWPEPAVPPPRCAPFQDVSQASPSNGWRGSNCGSAALGGGVPPSPTAFGSNAGRRRAPPGAASAPWANAFSNDVDE